MLQKPANGGTPAMASQPMMNVPAVIGISLRSAPIRRMSCSWCMPWMTEPGAEEQQRLEERVGDHVEDGRHVRTRADGQEHVAELADGGVREHLLDVVLRDGDRRGEQRGGDTDDRR